MSTNGSDTSIDSQGISIVSQSVNPHPLQRKNAQIIQTGQQTATPPNTDPTKKEGYLTSAYNAVGKLGTGVANTSSMMQSAAIGATSYVKNTFSRTPADPNGNQITPQGPTGPIPFNDIDQLKDATIYRIELLQIGNDILISKNIQSPDNEEWKQSYIGKQAYPVYSNGKIAPGVITDFFEKPPDDNDSTSASISDSSENVTIPPDQSIEKLQKELADMKANMEAILALNEEKSRILKQIVETQTFVQYASFNKQFNYLFKDGYDMKNISDTLEIKNYEGIYTNHIVDIITAALTGEPKPKTKYDLLYKIQNAYNDVNKNVKTMNDISVDLTKEGRPTEDDVIPFVKKFVEKASIEQPAQSSTHSDIPRSDSADLASSNKLGVSGNSYNSDGSVVPGAKPTDKSNSDGSVVTGDAAMSSDSTNPERTPESILKDMINEVEKIMVNLNAYDFNQSETLYKNLESIYTSLKENSENTQNTESLPPEIDNTDSNAIDSLNLNGLLDISSKYPNIQKIILLAVVRKLFLLSEKNKISDDHKNKHILINQLHLLFPEDTSNTIYTNLKTQITEQLLNKMKDDTEYNTLFVNLMKYHVINSIPSLINDKNDRGTVHKAIDARIQKATLTKGGANYVYLSAPPPKKTPKNITFAKKNHSKNMHAKSVRKLQNYIYN